MDAYMIRYKWIGYEYLKWWLKETDWVKVFREYNGNIPAEADLARDLIIDRHHALTTYFDFGQVLDVIEAKMNRQIGWDISDLKMTEVYGREFETDDGWRCSASEFKEYKFKQYREELELWWQSTTLAKNLLKA